MELQWPLILFTLFLAWSAGLFSTQSLYAFRGEGTEGQIKALIVSLVLLIIGGVAVFFHLQHPDRIFNGFGNTTSGITQELVFIVVIAVLMVVTFAMLRRSGGGAFPKALAVVNIVASLALVCVMGNSYLMSSRPAWNSMFEVLSLLGAACALGPATFALLKGMSNAADSEDANAGSKLDGLTNVAGTVIALVTTIAYIASMATVSGSFTDVGYHFDATHPTHALTNASSLSPFAGGALAPAILAIIGAALAVTLAVLGKKSDSWKLYGLLIVVCSAIACVALRVVFYTMGASVFMFY